MKTIDLAVEQYMGTIRTPHMTEYMILLSKLFDVTIQTVIVVLAIAILIFLVRGRRYGILFLLSMALTAVFTSILKVFFHISRPGDPVLQVIGMSFPSYHAAIATTFFIMVMYIFDDFLSGVGRVILNTFCIMTLFLVAFSRVYLGVHWVSDIIAGIMLGSLISYSFIAYFRSKKSL